MLSSLKLREWERICDTMCERPGQEVVHITSARISLSKTQSYSSNNHREDLKNTASVDPVRRWNRFGKQLADFFPRVQWGENGK